MNHSAPYTLAAGVRSVPLVNSWYAHPFLVSPLTFGLYTRHSHLAMLDSYLEDPEQHRACVQLPELRGGPFIDHPGDPDDIRRFKDETLRRCALPLRGAAAVQNLFRLLQSSAKGGALAGLYPQVDDLLRQGVELAYDVCKQPSARFIEPCFYDSPLYDTSLQSVRLEKAVEGPRDFILSTPQLARPPASLELKVPFADPLWQSLYDGSHGVNELLEMVRPHLGDAARQLPLIQDILAPVRPPDPAASGPADSVRVRYFGHACVLMQGAGVNVLVDPLISYPGESALDHFTFDDLPPRIDYVLITHPHQDHVVLETLLRLRHRIDHVVVGRAAGGSLQDISLKHLLQHCGFERVIELGEYESITFDGGRIVGAPFYGEHGDLDIRAKLVYGVEMHGNACLFLADSNPPAPEFYAPLRKLLPRVECMFLGMECVGAPATWLYGPMLQKTLTHGEDQARRLDGCNAAMAHRFQQYFVPKRLFVYAMGAEPWLTHLTSILYSEESIQFKEARLLEATVRAHGKHAEVLFGKMELLL
ncbi:MBL fold metallo-hydrolase [Caldimonas brevitalea]|nr:MBL fold metallo-hydrolase [Caldimonas brevitalea]